MSQPILARQDETALAEVYDRLPQSLLVVAELGLDSERLINKISTEEASDVIKLVPEVDKKHISTKQIRDLVMNLRTRGVRRRIVVVGGADAMTEEAQNALLKALEEPADKTHFILSVSDQSLLLETIISRCQIVTLHRTSPLQDSKLLGRSGLSESARRQILFLAAGRPNLIRQLMSDKEMLRAYREIAADAKAIISGVSYGSLVAAQRYSSREQALRLIDILLTMVRFQVKNKGLDDKMTELIERIKLAEPSLKSNSNVKLSMMNLVV